MITNNLCNTTNQEIDQAPRWLENYPDEISLNNCVKLPKTELESILIYTYTKIFQSQQLRMASAFTQFIKLIKLSTIMASAFKQFSINFTRTQTYMASAFMKSNRNVVISTTEKEPYHLFSSEVNSIRRIRHQPRKRYWL